MPATAAAATVAGVWFSTYDEFGSDRLHIGQAPTGTAPTRYGWLGAHERSTRTLGDLTLMGVRLYMPTTGRFLSVDPILGGNTTPYAYPQDPLSAYDLDGRRAHHKPGLVNPCWCASGRVASYRGVGGASGNLPLRPAPIRRSDAVLMRESGNSMNRHIRGTREYNERVASGRTPSVFKDRRWQAVATDLALRKGVPTVGRGSEVRYTYNTGAVIGYSPQGRPLTSVTVSLSRTGYHAWPH
ncbi:RHS repeat-associated core domain-containing protein [Actinotalea solisilvae]|uniref:RHS repeat-associated core domain-containing protein n=1 Tax=Actinotalea solisilvae TaxID=2072922 RepID=UPI0018F16AE5